jgi:excinuclease ABC subunit B
MYGDRITDSMDKAIKETERRRTIQMAYNEKHGITPQTIRKKIHDVIEATMVAQQKADYLTGAGAGGKLSKKERQSVIQRLEAEMKDAAKNLQFERAAELRDALLELRAEGD